MTTAANAGTTAIVAAKAGKRTMLLSLVALAGILIATAGFIYSQDPAPSLAQEATEGSNGHGEDQLGAMPANLKVRCIMPRAWRRDCPADER